MRMSQQTKFDFTLSRRAGFFAVLLVSPAAAMNVQPVVLDMSVAGASSKSSIQVINDSTKPLPVELVVQKLDLDEKGERLKKPAGDEFVLFPPQAIIPAGAAQVFRVQWVGEPELRKSQSYILSVNQLPVKLRKEASGMQVVFNFEVVVNVAPAGGEALLKQIAAEIAKDDHGVRRPAITVENAGTMHAYLSEASLRIESGAWHKSLSASELRQLIGLGLVQPGVRRRFLVPVDVPQGVSQLSMSLDYKPKQAK